MPAVAPLICENCGAPLGVAEPVPEEVACAACGTPRKVPSNVVGLLRAARDGEAARARAQILADELAAPPGLLERAWMAAHLAAYAGVLLTLVVWIVVGLVICVGMIWSAGIAAALVGLVVGVLLSIPLVYSELLHALAPALGVDLSDTLSAALAHALLGLAFFVLLALPSILGAYAEGFESVRATLRKVLAAKPPRVPGGPAECRECGAALEVREGTLHARCLYCSADNLVQVPESLLAAAKEDAKAKHHDVGSAHEAAARARAEGKRLAFQKGWQWLVGLVLGATLAGRLVAAILDDGATFWTRATTTGPMRPVTRENPYVPAGRPTELPIVKSFDRCRDDGCEAWYLVGLDQGERPLVAIEGMLVLDRVEQRHIGKWYNPTFEWKELDVSSGVPYRGWYRVVLKAPRKTRGTPIVTFTRAR